MASFKGNHINAENNATKNKSDAAPFALILLPGWANFLGNIKVAPQIINAIARPNSYIFVISPLRIYETKYPNEMIGVITNATVENRLTLNAM